MNNYQNKIIVIGGPTASGKTDLAIQLAKKINGVLINADSVQIYKEFNIGSNKGILDFEENIEVDEIVFPKYQIEKSGVSGFLFNQINPDETFNLFKYQQYARKLIKHIFSLNLVPIIVGGTGLYIDALIRNFDILENSFDTAKREKLESFSIEELQKLLPAESLELLNNSDKNNKYRLVRLIEKDGLISDFTKYGFVDHIFFYPNYYRNILYKKIDDRVTQMFAIGFVEEVKKIISKYGRDIRPLLSAGYRQVAEMLEIGEDFDQAKCIELVRIAHRQYAKRQITWFEGEKRGYNLVRVNSVEEMLSLVNK